MRAWINRLLGFVERSEFLAFLVVFHLVSGIFSEIFGQDPMQDYARAGVLALLAIYVRMGEEE